METTTRSVLCFGKLPIHGDFVRYGASGTAVQAIDEWFQQGLSIARERAPEKFDDAYDAAPAYAFVFTPRNASAALVGVTQPSRDRSGRRYPFLVAFEVDEAQLEAQSVARFPVRFGGFFSWATQLVREATSGRIAYRDLPDHLNAFNGATAETSARTPGYDRYLRQTSFRTFVERLWGDSSYTRKYLLFKNLTDIMLPIRGRVPPRFALGLRFPLTPEDSERTYAASFWLEVSLRLLGYPRVASTFFWTATDAVADTKPFLLFYLLSPPGQAFEDLLPVTAEGDHLCVLDEMGAEKAAQTAPSVPPHVAALLESEDLSLWDFRQRLEI